MAVDLLGGKYLLEQEIANGGCGTVYLGSHHIAGKPVAIKLEPAMTAPRSRSNSRMLKKAASNPNLRLHRQDQRHPPLPPQSPHYPGSPVIDNERDFNGGYNDQPYQRQYTGPSPLTLESQIYKRLMGGPGVPWIMYSGKQGDWNVMVIDLLGPSLEDLFKMCNRCWGLKTVLMVADQVISRIQYIHSHSLLHRDIKPSNFVIGTGSPKALSTVNIIDFGLAKKYKTHVKDTRTGDTAEEHIPYRQDECHGVGTSLFAGINTHLGIESSRRDDIESLAYMLIYFIRGTLPWRKVKAPLKPPPGTPEYGYDPVGLTWSMILEEKLAWEQTLCDGLPEEFGLLYRYARSLSFTDLPDYDGLRRMFKDLADRCGWDLNDGEWDWSSNPKFRQQYGDSAPVAGPSQPPPQVEKEPESPTKRARDRTRSPKKGANAKENRKRSVSRPPAGGKGTKGSPQQGGKKGPPPSKGMDRLGRLKSGMMSSPDLSTPPVKEAVPHSPLHQQHGANGGRWCEACRGRARARLYSDNGEMDEEEWRRGRREGWR